MLLVLHTYTQLLLEWVIIGLLVLGTIVALLLEPVQAMLRRSGQQPPQREYLAVRRLMRGWSSAARRAVSIFRSPRVLALVGGASTLLVLLVYSLATGRAFALIALLVASLSAPDRLARMLAHSPPAQPLAVIGVAGVAVGMGAAHALTPGHSKTLVAAYLIGTRGTAAQALLLGLSVTVTHTAGVFALGGVSLMFMHFVAPERVLPWIEALAGALVVLLGTQLLRQRLQSARLQDSHSHSHAHAHGPDTHTHLPAHAGDGRGWLMLGVAGGLVPCPTALVLLLTAIGLGRAELGLVLTVAFSTGLASVLTGVGLLFVHGRRWLAQREKLIAAARWVAVLRMVPVASAVCITVIGIGITLSALVQAAMPR